MKLTGTMTQLDHNGTALDVYEAVPKGEIKGGIILIHEVWALTNHIKSIADRYAAEGYLTIAPNLLFETDIAKHAATLPLEYFNLETRNEAQPKLRELMTPMREPDFGEKTLGRVKACFEYLYAKPEVHEWVAVTGYCFGGTYSYNLAIHEPRLKAAIPFYGHAPLELDELKQIKCPILAFYGATDESLIEDLPELKQLMKEAHIDYTTKVYPDCGHAFFNDTNPYAYNEAAATDAWKRALSFLATVTA